MIFQLAGSDVAAISLLTGRQELVRGLCADHIGVPDLAAPEALLHAGRS